MKLSLKGVRKEFTSLRGRTIAVQDLDMDVADSEFFVLLGPSGCGKSTVLNLIAGLEKPTEGEILFDERLVASAKKRFFLTPRERNVAMVFQTYALYPHLSVYENIAFPLRVRRMEKVRVEAAVKRAASRLEIEELLPARPAELSGGQRQRVAIARAIVREPDVFLLDEPLSNLDAQLRASTRAELKLLQKSLGITTVYVTHDQVEALTLGEKIAVLRAGKIEQIGTPEELYGAPANPFVAQFIGSPPMNLVPASLAKENQVSYVSFGAAKLRIPDDITDLSQGTCLFGIRPEDMVVSRSEEAGSFSAHVDALQPLGREAILNVSIEGNPFSVLTRDTGFSEGETVYVRFNVSKAHIFPGPG